jgi:hypothetical protein
MPRKPSEDYQFAKVWLLDYMGEGVQPQPVDELIAAAEDAGVNLDTLNDVAQRYKIIHVKMDGDKRWYVRWPKVRRPRGVSELEWAAGFLREQLVLGPRYAHEIWHGAREHDVLRYRYHQAAKILGVVKTEEEIPLADGEWMEVRCRWELPII